MPDIFDTLSPNVPPRTRSRKRDIFDDLSDSPDTGRSNAPETMEITSDNHIQMAARELDYWKGKTGLEVPALAKQAVVDQYRMAAGMAPLLGRDHYKTARRRINERNAIFNFASGAGQSIAGMGSDIVSTIAPETGRRMSQNADAYYGPTAEGAAGVAGELVGMAATMIPALYSGNPGLLATQFGLAGAGGVRQDVAERRAEGQDISGMTEWTAALLTGGVEAASGFVGARLAGVMGRAMSGLAPGTRMAFEAGGRKGATAFLMSRLPKALGAVAGEYGEESLTQIVTNAIAKVSEIDEERKLTEGAHRAGLMAAALTPFLGPIATARSRRRAAGAQEEKGQKRALRRPPGQAIPAVRQQAADYMRGAGLAHPGQIDYSPVNTKLAGEIAQEYDQMEHNPSDPMVAKSYDAFKKETKAQFDYLKSQGVKFELNEDEPYNNSDEMRADVAQGRHKTFKQEDLPPDHPLAETDPDTGWTYNQMFRAVHDYFGHSHDGNGFGPRGEEHAWRMHSQMYSLTARGAMTSETRGQNSWINYGPHGEANRADPANTTFAEQKAGLMAPIYMTYDGKPPPPPGEDFLTDLPDFGPEKRSLLKARRRVERLMLNAERDYRAKVARANQRTQKWERDFTDAELRDVGALVESIGRTDMEGDTLHSVRQRTAPLRFRKMIMLYRKVQEAARNEVNKYLEDTGEAEYIAFLTDYLPHFYVRSGAAKGKSFEDVGRWLIKNAPNAKKRKIPTLAEAVEAGLVPVTQNIAVLHRMWMNYSWRAATVRKFLHGLKEVRQPGGEPMVLPAGKAPAGWVSVHHPILQKLYARRDPKSGKIVLWKGGAKVHPEIAPFVKALTDRPFSNKFVWAIEGINAWAKKTALSLSLFHHIALTESANAVLANVVNPIRGAMLIGEIDPTTRQRVVTQPHRVGVRLMRDTAILEDAIQHGLTLESTADHWISRIQEDLSKLTTRLASVPVLGKATRIASKANEWWDSALWNHYHSGLKMFAWHDIMQKELIRMETEGTVPTSEQIREMKETIATFINDAFGGQEWENTVFRNPKVRQVLQWVMLAPDWTWSNLKIAGRTVPSLVRLASGHPLSLRDRLQVRYWRNMIPSLYGSAAALQFVIFSAFGDEEEGDKPWIWQNEEGKTWDIDVTPIMRKLPWREEQRGREKQRYYTHFGKQAREVMSWVENPIQVARRKSSPNVQIAFEQLTGSQGDGFDLPFAGKDFYAGLTDRGKAIGEKFVPFSFRGNNFAFSAPMSKGVTPWKLRTAFAKELRAYAEPSLLSKLALQDPDYEHKLESLVVDTLEAAERNGHDGPKFFRQALGLVRGELYREYFQALSSADEGGMQKAADAIVRLHSGLPNLIASARHRDIDLADEEISGMIRQFEEARRRVQEGD